MPRIRTIKPEFPQSESMGRVSRDARLAFIMLWTLADDSGRLRGNSRMLASLLFPYDLDAGSLIDGWLDELNAEGCIVRYKVEGDSYIQIAKWLIHQKIDRPSASKNPAPIDGSRILANPRESSCKDQGSRIKDQGPRIEEKGSGKKTARASALPPRPESVDAQVWADWLALRKAKRAPVTATVVQSAAGEAEKAGLSLDDFLRVWCARGSQGLQADWLQPHERGRASVRQPEPEVPRWKIHQARRMVQMGGRSADAESREIVARYGLTDDAGRTVDVQATISDGDDVPDFLRLGG